MWCKYLAAELAWWIEPNRERFVHGREPPYYTPSYSWASVKGQINSAGPFALGILVDVAFVPLNLKPLSQNVWNEDFFGFSRQPFFWLQVMGKLRAGRIRKIDDDWRIAPNMVCDAEYKKADNAKFSSVVFWTSTLKMRLAQHLKENYSTSCFGGTVLMRVIILWSDHKFIACCSSFSTRRRGSFAELDGLALLSLIRRKPFWTISRHRFFLYRTVYMRVFLESFLFNKYIELNISKQYKRTPFYSNSYRF